MNNQALQFNQQKMVTISHWLLVIVFLWLTVNFIWSFWPQPEGKVAIQRPSAQSQERFNKQTVLSAQLFGKADTTAAPQQITAPVTRLKLKLRGVYAAEDKFSSALIEHNKDQQAYRVGAKLPGAAGLTLYKVLADRVVMSRGGKYETLFIEDFDGSSSPPASRRQTMLPVEPIAVDMGEPIEEPMDDDLNIIDKRTDPRVTEQLISLRDNLNDPSALSELVAISPVVDDGQFSGFRISPGKNRALFGRLGLRRNDIVTAVNGIPLDDPSSGFNILEQISSADEINLAIKRGDRDLNVLFSAVEQ